MEKHRTNRCARSAKQVEEMRRLYSKIGQPLPAEIIIDLYRHLGKALEIHDADRPKARRPKSCVRA